MRWAVRLAPRGDGTIHVNQGWQKSWYVGGADRTGCKFRIALMLRYVRQINGTVM